MTKVFKKFIPVQLCWNEPNFTMTAVFETKDRAIFALRDVKVCVFFLFSFLSNGPENS